MTAAGTDEASDLAMRKGRFASSETEQAFLEWQALEALGENRSAAIGGLVVGLIQAAMVWALRPAGILPWLLLLCVPEAAGLGALLASRRPGAHRWFQDALAIVMTATGLVTVAVLVFHLRSVAIAFAATAALAFIPFATYRIRAVHGAVGVAGYCVFDLALTTWLHGRGVATTLEWVVAIRRRLSRPPSRARASSHRRPCRPRPLLPRVKQSKQPDLGPPARHFEGVPDHVRHSAKDQPAELRRSLARFEHPQTGLFRE